MAIEVIVPRLGWSMDEGTFVEWLVRDGERVEPGDMLFVIEGDKATQQVESFDGGILRLLPDGPQPGDSVRVGQLLAYLVEQGEEVPLRPTSASSDSSRAQIAIPAAHASSERVQLESAPGEAISASRVHASPRARRLAARLGIDWRRLAGSGRSSRVRERDVLAAAEVADRKSDPPG